MSRIFRRTAHLAVAALASVPVFGGAAVFAQDAVPTSSMPNMPNIPMANTPMGKSAMTDMPSMPSSVDLLAPMTQEASGTAWLPAASPMYGKMIMKPNGDMLMLHGAAMPRYVDTGSDRGDRRVDAPNWFMGMYSHPLDAKDQLGLRAMVSLDPLTEGGRGYPLLFQTGETWHGQPLHDHQHPHDLFSELSVDYSRQIAAHTSAYLYLGYPGEPALGPPTYMHRLIAYDLPDAPIGHHWQDATHITFGVATAGLNLSNRVKFETSVFTGREPDENRYNFERPRFDSQSARLSYNSDARNAFQISYGSIRNPEGDGVGQHRTTASWIYDLPLGDENNLTTTLSYGQNLLADAEGRSHSVLLEADYNFGRNALFSRIERIQKSGNELSLPSAFASDDLYALGAYTFGYLHDLSHGKGIDTGIGGAITLNSKPSNLDPIYGGSSLPIGFQVMLRFRPSRTRMDAMAGMSGMSGMANMPGMGKTGEMATQHAAEGEGTVTATLASGNAVAHQATQITVIVHDAKGAPVTGAAVTGASNMAMMDMETTNLAFREVGNGIYTGDVTFAMAGSWRVTVTVTPKGGAGDGGKMVRTFEFAARRG